MLEIVLLTVAGDHVPLTPLLEVFSKTGTVLPLQISFNAVNVGVVFGVIICVSEAVNAHWFASGVKV